MAELIHVKAAEGLRLYDPVRKDRVGEAWRQVEYSAYWQRLATMGDAVLSRVAPSETDCEGYEAPADMPVKPARRKKAAAAAEVPPVPAPEPAI